LRGGEREFLARLRPKGDEDQETRKGEGMRLGELREMVEQAEEEDLPTLGGWLREAELLVEMRLRTPPLRDAAPVSEPLTYDELAKALRTSVSYLKILVSQEKIPYLRLPAADKAGRPRDGRLIRFDLAEVRDAMRRLQEKV
jgi:hypothetical protein